MRVHLPKLFMLIGLVLTFRGVHAQSPNINYSPTSNSYTDGTAITPWTPTNSGGAATGGYSIPFNYQGIPTPYGVATDAAGNVYAVDNVDGVLYQYTPAGVVNVIDNGNDLYLPTCVAVDKTHGLIYVGDASYIWEYNTAGTLLAQLPEAAGTNDIALDAAGNVYFVTQDNRLRTVPFGFTSSTPKTTIATGFTNAFGIAINGSDIYVSDIGSNSIIKVANGTSGGTTETTFATGFNKPSHMTFDAAGNLYVADNGSNTIKEITPAAVVSTFLSGLNGPLGIAFDTTSPHPNIFEADNTSGFINESSYGNYSINAPLPAGLAFDTSTGTISGTPTGPSNATVYTVTAYNASGSSSFNITVSVVTPPPAISYTPAGGNYVTGTAIAALTPVNTGGTVHALGFSTTGTALTGGTLLNPLNMTIDAAGNVYVADPHNHTVLEYNSSGAWVKNIGSGFTNPNGIVFDSAGNAYVVDHGAPAVYKITPAGVQTTIISGTAGFLYGPWAIAIDGSDNLYVANNENQNVTKYDNNGNRLLTIKGGGMDGPVGVVVDAAGNIYVLNYGTDSEVKHIYKYNANGTFLGIFGTAPLYSPLGIGIDADGDIYVADQGFNGLGSNTGTINVYSPSGTMFTQLTGLYDPRGVIVDPAGNLYVSDYTSNTITKYPPTAGYFINKPLPAGLSFNSTTGQITGTPTVASPSTVYTITAYNTGGSGSTTVTISCYAPSYDWVGGTSNSWGDPTNWSANTVPTATNTATIGVNVAFTNAPLIRYDTTPGDVTVAAILLGTNGGQAASLTVTSSAANGLRTLNVTGAITYQSDAGSTNGYTATLAGTGTINANSINVIANTVAGSSYNETLASSATSLNVTTNIALTSSNSGAKLFNAKFNLTGSASSVTTLTGVIQTSNTAGTTSAFAITGAATLQLNNAAALSGLSATGTNTINFKGTNATIIYGGAAQTVYTDAVANLTGGASYQNITFSGTGIKTVSTGNLNIAGTFNNNFTTDASDYVDFTNPTIQFNGTTAQSLTGVATSKSTFYKVTFSGNSTKTMTTGSFAIASSGVLTMGGTTSNNKLAAGASLLTLNSDATGSASVAAITNSQSITGTVNVQRFITGGSMAERSYRLLSSPVYASAVSPNNVYSINYLERTCYSTGTTGTSGGFDKGGNPSLYLYRENLAPSNASFLSGNFRGINTIGTGTADSTITNINYLIDGDAGTFNIPAANGYLFYFRGNKSQATLAQETTSPYVVPANTILTATGTLNQGSVTVHDWYTPSSGTLGWTNATANTAVRGYNLVGNPYACSIDWDTYGTGIVAGGTPISTSMYILDPISKNYSVYAAGAHGVGTIATSQANIIPSGQGFFVIASDATSTLTFNESAKTTTQATQSIGNLFLAKLPIAPTVDQSMHIMLKKDSTNIDGLFIKFNDGAKAQFDISKDAPYKQGSGIASLSSRSADSVALAIHTLALPKQGQTRVGLNVNSNADGIYTLNLMDIKSIPALYEVWLMDAYKKDSVDLRANPTYNFNIYKSDAASFGANRFSLVIRQNSALSVHLLNFTANKASNGAQVVWTTDNEQNYTNFTVERSTDNGKTFDVLGGMPSDGQGSYSLLDREPLVNADQYRLKMQDLNGAITYSNIVILLYSNLSNTIVKNSVNIYPNPATSTINLSVTKAVSNVALYGIEIVNSGGTVIKTATTTQPGWQSDVTGLLPGTYIIRVVNNGDKSLIGRGTFIKL